jgi:two-component system, NarL family, response regulator DevR
MPEVTCLMLTSFADDDALMDAVMAGRPGNVLKQPQLGQQATVSRTVHGSSVMRPSPALSM